MNYEKCYHDIIFSRANLKREKSAKFYFELHHILPKSLGGTDAVDNLVLLTPKEHFICHQLLVYICQQKYGIESSEYHKMIKALCMMANYKKYKEISTARTYEKIKIRYSKCISKRMSKLHKGTTLSEEHKTKIGKNSSRRKWMKNPKTGEEKFVIDIDWNYYQKNGFVFGRSLDQSNRKNPMFGYVYSKDECIKRSKRRSLMNKLKPPAKGKVWVNNGICEKYVFPDKIPLGYSIGRCKVKKLQKITYMI